MKRSYICIDALDEFPREYRQGLFKSLIQVTQESPGTRLFLTGREHIREEIGRFFTRGAEIQIEPTCCYGLSIVEEKLKMKGRKM